ncbi:cytochrome P450 [Streptomyces turgidiscabies]|uniref:Unspecific monooxygenase n=1 Tax=Streptomyces turgidiscabies (strain Car8) TaxID=698760 RepID=L7F2J7_STRT8|nr:MULTISPECIES: cytochrome P450 [Streptomyces]ELP65201.1 unspecific monooxygenase [Streptomyces turgidiscabies Car8]MDX3494642.1 cytochrome P450 [Streptomyces turgidiscabies]GAQ71249.1 pentalenic acid synthase [Streptomyces turgidiscabies]
MAEAETRLTPDEQVYFYQDDRDAKCPFAPPPGLRALHDKSPISRARIWDGSTPWLVTGHAAQRAILSDPRVSSNDKQAGFPYPNRPMAETAHQHPLTIFNADGADHTRIRRMMTRPFTRPRMEALRPRIQEFTDELIDKMLAGPKPANLVTALSLPLPSLMICALLGVPYEDHDFFQEHASWATRSDKTTEQQESANRALGGYLAGVLQKKMEEPTEDVLSDFAARIKDGDLTLPEAVLLSMILLIAGHETSASMITLGTALLLENPAQLAELREIDDTKAVANAVEEILRYLSVPQLGQRRIAAEDFEFEGVQIKAGDGIVVPLPAGNWDPEAFPEPEKLDLTRKASHHVAFGWGIHQCLGQQLARIELQVVYGTLFRRVPTLRLAVDRDELDFRPADALAFGISELPVTW